MASQPRVGFIGTGKMATALATGWRERELVDTEESCGSDPYAGSREEFSRVSGIRAVESNSEVWSSSDVVVLAVKPHVVESVLREAEVKDSHLVISIAAGISLEKMEKAAGDSGRFVRVMPNTPVMIGYGAAGYACGSKATEEDSAMVNRFFNASGVGYEVTEKLIDSVTGLSGSGPAYIYQVIEAMSDGGVAAGLPRPIATNLAAQTVAGAAHMVLETGKHPGELKDMVTSPGGTTITGLHQLELSGVRAAFINAILAATEKSRELGGQ